MKKNLLVLVVILGFVPNVQSISQNVVYASALGSGMGVGLLTRYISNSNVAGLITGLGGGFLTYSILNQFTPEGRLARAQLNFERINRNYFANNRFESEDAFLEALNDVYLLYDLPLIMAYNDLASLIEQGFDALNLLDAARTEGDIAVIQQCEILIPRIHHAIDFMTQAVKYIRSSAEYLKQVKIYKEMQAAKESLAVQRQIAQAQMYRSYTK